MLRLAVADDCDQLIEQILAIFPLTQMGLSIDMPNFACIGAMGAPEFGQSMSAAEINERIVAACSYNGGKRQQYFGAGPKAVNRPSIDTVSTSGGATSRAPATGEPKGGRSSAAHQATATQPRLRTAAHTSELQSLMTISYAVFCLKKTHMINTK